MIFCVYGDAILPVTILDLDGVVRPKAAGRCIAWRLRRARCMKRWPSLGGQARGLAALRGREWVAGVEQSIGLVKVSVADVRVEHEVKLGNFTKWVERRGGSPREVFQRGKVREILGMGR